MKKSFLSKYAGLFFSASVFFLFSSFVTKSDPDPGPVELPARYYWLMSIGSDQVAANLKAHPGITLEELEKNSGTRHFPFAILAPAVLYIKKHQANHRYHDTAMLALAKHIGDMMADESEKDNYESRSTATGILICGWKLTVYWKAN